MPPHLYDGHKAERDDVMRARLSLLCNPLGHRMIEALAGQRRMTRAELVELHPDSLYAATMVTGLFGAGLIHSRPGVGMVFGLDSAALAEAGAWVTSLGHREVRAVDADELPHFSEAFPEHSAS